MKTIRAYYHSAALTGKATVLKLTSNGKGGIVILNRTIFCPQGGGQPADFGTLGGAIVTHVEAPKDAPEIILHTVSTLDRLTEGTEVELTIDASRRLLHSRLHTGGHLLAALVEQLLGGAAKACGGHHWPGGEARVEFICEASPYPAFQAKLETAITNAIYDDLVVRANLADDGNRYVQIGGFPLLRCGGTHVARLQELGGVAIRSVKHKQGRLRVGYDVTAGTGNTQWGA